MSVNEQERSVLVIEDDRETRELIVRKLTKRGFKTHTAETADEGIDYAKKEKSIGIILLDIALPDQSGIDTASSLKKHPETKHLPIIAVSGYIDYRNIKKLEHAGFDTYCLKPIDFDRLFRTITGFFRQSHNENAS